MCGVSTLLEILAGARVTYFCAYCGYEFVSTLLEILAWRPRLKA